MALDTSLFYRLTNNFIGTGQSLDVRPDGSCRLMMAPSGDFSGQHWRLVERGQSKYALQTWYLGDCFSLDVINDGVNNTPWLAPTGDSSGQRWTLTPWGDGTYRLRNDLTGPDRSLDTYSGTHDPFVGGGDHSGQHWTITPLREIPRTTPIPDLDPKGDVHKTEGPTDFTFYARPRGVVRAAMVFVDFPDAPAGSTSATATANHLLGDGQAQQLYRDQSYGQLSLDVTVRSDLGWRRMPEPSTSYDLTQFETHRTYVSAAANLFQAAEIKFSDFQFVFVVAPEAASFPLSPAFNARPGTGAASPSGEIRLAVTFGSDSYRNRFINLVHEVGHLFGLPDLYSFDGGGAETSKAGCWSIMSDIFRSVSFLGWHRHKNGWLPASRASYLAQTTPAWYATLHPLSGTCGLSMLVLPVDDPLRPSKVFVVELAQAVLADNGTRWGDGVLVYTVDATIESGSAPVVVVPKRVSTSPDYGHLYEAPYYVGDVARAGSPGSAALTVTVLQKFGSSYNVKVEYRRP